MLCDSMIETNLKSSYYDNLNSNIFGEQIRQLTDNGCSIPIKFLNVYEKMFDKIWNKQKLTSILNDLHASLYLEGRGYKWVQKVNEDGGKYLVFISQSGSRVCDHFKNPLAPLVYSRILL